MRFVPAGDLALSVEFAEEISVEVSTRVRALEYLIQQKALPGVVETEVGYTGGSVRNATYENHEGHAEAVQITRVSPIEISADPVAVRTKPGSISTGRSASGPRS